MVHHNRTGPRLQPGVAAPTTFPIRFKGRIRLTTPRKVRVVSVRRCYQETEVNLTEFDKTLALLPWARRNFQILRGFKSGLLHELTELEDG